MDGWMDAWDKKTEQAVLFYGQNTFFNGLYKKPAHWKPSVILEEYEIPFPINLQEMILKITQIQYCILFELQGCHLKSF